MDLSSKVNNILSKIPCVDLTGTEYIQYPKKLIDDTERELVQLIDEELGTSFIEKGWNRQGIIGRYVDDSGKKELYGGWHFFMSIDESYRKWEQMYYTIPKSYEKHKHEAICVNDNPELKRQFRNLNLDTLLK